MLMSDLSSDLCSSDLVSHFVTKHRRQLIGVGGDRKDTGVYPNLAARQCKRIGAIVLEYLYFPCRCAPWRRQLCGQGIDDASHIGFTRRVTCQGSLRLEDRKSTRLNSSH